MNTNDLKIFWCVLLHEVIYKILKRIKIYLHRERIFVLKISKIGREEDNQVEFHEGWKRLKNANILGAISAILYTMMMSI